MPYFEDMMLHMNTRASANIGFTLLHAHTQWKNYVDFFQTLQMKYALWCRGELMSSILLNRMLRLHVRLQPMKHHNVHKMVYSEMPMKGLDKFIFEDWKK